MLDVREGGGKLKDLEQQNRVELGICTGFSGDGTYSIPHLEFIREMGFNYLELPLNAVAALDEVEFAKLLTAKDTWGLPVLCMNCFMDSSVALTGDKACTEKIDSYVKAAVKRAHALGVKKLVLGSGASRNAPPGFSLERANKQLLNALDIMLKYTEPLNILLILEHLNNGESNLITSFREAAALVSRLNRPGLRSILDFYHFKLGNEADELIVKNIDLIGHVHYARTLGRCFPEYGDIPDSCEQLRLLKQAGYRGSLSMECAFPNMGDHPKEYIKVLEAISALLNS